jgi:hypothetical protein
MSNPAAVELSRLLNVAGNDQCCDCGAPQPRFASITIGIFLCASCAAAHRTLGTHASAVKSVDGDTWRTEWLSTLQRVGNAKANELFEWRVPAHFNRPEISSSPTPHEKLRLEKWVSAKYVLRLFAAPQDLKFPGYNWESNVFLSAWARKLN